MNADRYAQLAETYMSNARKLLQDGEAEKAGELLWGAVVTATKAAAARRGQTQLKYQGLKAFVRQAAKELEDPAMFSDFMAIESLHGRFYEGGVSIEEGAAAVDIARAYLARLPRP